MYKRSAILICIIYLILSGVLFPLAVKRNAELPVYSAYGSCARNMDDSGFYYSDGRETGIRLYDLADDGRIEALYSASEGGGIVSLWKEEDRLYALVSDMIREEDRNLYRSYRIRIFTKALLPLDSSAPLMLHSNEQAVDLMLKDGVFFITAIADDGEKAEVYSVTYDSIISDEVDTEALANGDFIGGKSEGEEPAEEEPVVLDSIYLMQSGEGRFFVDGNYRNGELALRTDADVPEGEFSPDSRLIRALELTDPSFSQCLTLSGKIPVYWFAGSMLILVFLIMLFVAFYNRRRLVYTALLSELVFTAMLIVFYFSYDRAGIKALQNAREDYAKNALSSFRDELGGIDGAVEGYEAGDPYYETDDYRIAQGRLSAFVRRAGISDVFYDVLLVSVPDGKVIMSAGGRNRQQVGEIYGNAAGDLWKTVREGESTADGTLLIGGQEYGATLLSESGARSSAMLFGVYNRAGITADVWQGRVTSLGKFLLIYVIGSLLLFFVIYLQAADLRRFEKALSKVATDGSVQKAENVTGRDLDSMWNSLMEIQKKIEKINYSRYRIYEAYYRFAPKNIETILGKDSITEVSGGEAAKLTGTLALVAGNETAGADERIDHINGLIRFLQEHSENEGILISNNSEMSIMEILFLEDVVRTQNFGIDLVRENLSAKWMIPDITVFLYYGSYTYGVAGTEEQSLSFLLAGEILELTRYAEWLRTLRLGLVITEEIRDREEVTPDLRCIGFIRLESGRKLRLYEVLDACSQRDRQAKMADMEHFTNAMDCFYRQDYYLARTRFSDILKRNPEDEVVRWYLFESERLLDADEEEARDGALRIGSR
ncbi:MAG: hypothetical protein K6F53_12495 [Lachnospiraceae bacterium]|nr:hypothetical protein [Lachnospiraceae bacterium]